MTKLTHQRIETHHYCIFSQKENCLGYPIEPDHPACNCIDLFVVDANTAPYNLKQNNSFLKPTSY